MKISLFELNGGHLEASMDSGVVVVVNETLKMAGVSKNEIDKVIMTGGSSLIPKFRFLMEEMFGKNRVMLFEPFTAVSKGLAVISNKMYS